MKIQLCDVKLSLATCGRADLTREARMSQDVNLSTPDAHTHTHTMWLFLVYRSSATTEGRAGGPIGTQSHHLRPALVRAWRLAKRSYLLLFPIRRYKIIIQII